MMALNERVKNLEFCQVFLVRFGKAEQEKFVFKFALILVFRYLKKIS
jgi:hypothetical protein